MQKWLRRALFLALVYTIGLVLGLFALFLRCVHAVKISGRDRLFPKERGRLILSNHLSIVEGPLLPLLCLPKFIFNPVKYFPWSTPDRKNYYRYFWNIIWPEALRIIPIDRESGRNEESLAKIRMALLSGESVIIFPEGTRFVNTKERKTSPKGNQIGRFKTGILKILKELECDVVLVWIEGTDKVMPKGAALPRFHKGSIRIRVSTPMSSKFSVDEFEDKMLRLADGEKRI